MLEKYFTEREWFVIQAVLKVVLLTEDIIEDWEFPILFGVDRKTAIELMNSINEVENITEDLFLTVHACLGNLVGYPHGYQKSWNEKFPFTKNEVDFLADKFALLYEDLTNKPAHICLVCGYPDLDDKPRSDKTGGASYEICPSCGFQFGVSDDSDGITYEKWRESWIKNGMQWSGVSIKAPANWNPRLNLLRVKSQK